VHDYAPLVRKIIQARAQSFLASRTFVPGADRLRFVRQPEDQLAYMRMLRKRVTLPLCPTAVALASC